jgi:hypothetical protein
MSKNPAKLSIQSDQLPAGIGRDWWRGQCLRLWFLCTVVLKKAWDDKFQNWGVLQKMLCEFLQPQENSEDRRLFASVFRGSYKSTVLLGLCVFLFTWSLATGSPVSIVYNTGTKENAEAFMEDFRTTLANCTFLHWIFPELPKSSQEYRKWTRWRVEFKNAKFHVASLDTRQVSRHYTVIINDDLVNDDNAFSEKERENVIRKWKLQKSILTRYSKLRVGWEIDVGTPYQQSDLISHIIKNVRTYRKFIMPYALEDGRGPVDPRKENGILTFPEMFCWEDFRIVLEDQGESIFATQYGLRILDDAARLASEKWIRYWDELPRVRWRALWVDPAGTEDEKNCPSGYLVADVDPQGTIYLVYATMKWLSPYKSLKFCETISQQFKTDDNYIEAEKLTIVMSDTVDKLAPYFNFSPVPTHNKNKHARIHRLKQWFETGRILFAPGMEWLAKIVLDYPSVQYFELLDCLAHLVANMNIPKANAIAPVEEEKTDFRDEILAAIKRTKYYHQGRPADDYF